MDSDRLGALAGVVAARRRGAAGMLAAVLLSRLRRDASRFLRVTGVIGKLRARAIV